MKDVPSNVASDADSTAPAIQSTLINYIEVWQPADDGKSMRLQDYARVRDGEMDFGTSERRVRSGEGIAGMAWHRRSAIILQESPSELLQRFGIENGLDLSALIAFPVMCGHDVLSVVVFGIGEGPGAFEIWSRDDRDELAISASYYSGLKSLEFISRYVRFPKGAGLPGTVWKTGQPKLAPSLAGNPTFMRSCDAEETQLSTGLGLPVGSFAGHADSVLVLLSSNDRPIASLFEIWTPNTATDASPEFRLLTADWDTVTNDVATSRPECHAAVRSAWQSGWPVLSADVPPVHLLRNGEVDSIKLRAVLAMPVFRGAEQIAVVVLKF